MNFSPDTLQRTDTEGKTPYRLAEPKRELPSPLTPALMIYLSLYPYWPLSSKPTLLVCVCRALRRDSAFWVREGEEGSCSSEEAVLDVKISCDTLLLS